SPRERESRALRLALVETPVRRSDPEQLWPDLQIPSARHRVVDIFSGCGGLSLGFEKFGGVVSSTLFWHWMSKSKWSVSSMTITCRRALEPHTLLGCYLVVVKSM